MERPSEEDIAQAISYLEAMESYQGDCRRALQLIRWYEAERAEAKARERRAFEAGQEGEYVYDPVAECSDWSHKFPTFEDYEKAEEKRRQREERRQARKIRRQQKEKSSGSA